MRLCRRIAPVVALTLLLAACASPAVTLRLRYPVGKVRTYRVTATVLQKIDVATLQDTETIELEATSRVEVIDVGTGGATLKVTVTPTRLERNGKKADLPEVQEVSVQVSEDGTIAGVQSPRGGQVSPDDIIGVAPLIGATLPTGRVRLGDRWRRTLAAPPAENAKAGVQLGRLAAYRVVDEHRCAVVELDSRRPLTLTRQAAGTQLNLTGTEVTATQVSIDIADGFPVLVEAEAEGSFAVQGAPSKPGDVIIRTKTELRLVS
jgi:hypothetical protein